LWYQEHGNSSCVRASFSCFSSPPFLRRS
jgi:hypothetical protein